MNTEKTLERECGSGAVGQANSTCWGRVEYLIIAAALLVRVCWSIVVPVVPVSDCAAYDLLASNLAVGHGYTFEPGGAPTAYWPVGYPGVLGGLYWIFGHVYAPATVLNILLGVATVAISMQLTEHWFGASARRICGLILALWPSQVAFVTVLASEIPFIALVLVALSAWFTGRRPVRSAVLAGVALAAAAYVRPTALLLPAVFALSGLLTGRGAAREFVKAVTAVAVMAALIAPWVLRNVHALGHPVLISTNGGANLWMGNHPGSSGGYTQLPPETASMSEVERDEYLGRKAKDYIHQNPASFVRGWGAKFIITHDRETIGVSWNEPGLAESVGPWCLSPLKVLVTVYWFAAAGCALVGAAVLVRRAGLVGGLGHPIVLVALYFTAIHTVVVAQDRYHFPIIPLAAMLAGLALTNLPRPGRSDRWNAQGD